MNWPWTDLNKKLSKALQHRVEECETFASVDELFEHIKSIKHPWYQSMYNYVMWTLNDWIWRLYRIVRPCHSNIRKSIPKTWADLTEVIRYVNFAIIKDFYENETSFIDWNANESHQQFLTWLQESYEYICVGRPNLEKELEQAWNSIDNKIQGVERYAQVDALEEKINQRDTAVLVALVQNRQYFWS